MSSVRRPGDPPGPARLADPYRGERLSMVTEQLVRRGITDARVIKAMNQVPRHLFVDDEVLDYTRVHRRGDDFETLQDMPWRYVNLIGRYGGGWP